MPSPDLHPTRESTQPAAGPSGRRFHAMLKPSGSTCNLDCAYCFYLSKETLPNGPGTGRMSDEVLERVIQQYIAGVDGPEVVFSWQGGEPTLMGLPFYEKVVALQRKHAKPGQRIENDLQTNGTLLDEDWAGFLKQHRFLVGLSIDGPRELHDTYRVTKGGRPTFDTVFAAAQLLQRHGVRFNTLTCVNRVNARKPLDVYRFLRGELASTFIQFIPIVEYRGFDTKAPGLGGAKRFPVDGSPEARPGHPQSIVTDWSVDSDDWGYFLRKVFDRWVANDVGKVIVNQFETLVSQHMGRGTQICVYSPTCGRGVAVEHDGSVYSCDHYVYPEFQLGNVRHDTLANLVDAPAQTYFGEAKSANLPHYCRRCPFLTDCWGECPKNRILQTPDGEPGLNYLCRGMKAFYAHAIPEIDRLARHFQAASNTPR